MNAKLFQRRKCLKGSVRVFFLFFVGVGITGSIIVQKNVVETENLIRTREKFRDSLKILILSGKIAEVGQILQCLRIGVGIIVEMHLISQGERGEPRKNLHIRFVKAVRGRKIDRFRILCRAVLIHRLCIVKLPLFAFIGIGTIHYLDGQGSNGVIILRCDIL